MATQATDQKEVVAFLSDPTSYGIDTSIQVHQTHGSFVFLAGDHAYKLKRAVKFPYMDYSTPAKRRAMCERELIVNQRMAPMLYESVCSVINDEGKWRFGTPEDAKAVDWVVVMRRFNQGDLFEEKRKAGKLSQDEILYLAEVIAEFHRHAPVIRAFGGASAIRAVVDENVAMLQGTPDGLCPAASVASYAALSDAWLRSLRATLGLRRQAGFVRRCHGDLHLNNICLFAGKPVLFDGVEFADSFSCIDIAYDLAFVLMDLDSHGMSSHANALLNRYLESSGDYAGLAALPLFLACRAAIRAHVTIASQTRSGTMTISPAQLLDQAISYLSPPPSQLIAVGGLSGAGKSLLAHSLAPLTGRSPGAIVLRTDAIRKAMFGVPQNQRLGESAYERSTTLAVYDKLFEVAATVLKTGHSVVADAVFGDDSERNRIEALAKEAGAEFHAIWLTAPRPILEERIANRIGDASDATITVLQSQIASVSEPTGWSKVSAVGRPAEVLAEAERAVGLHAKLSN